MDSNLIGTILLAVGAVVMVGVFAYPRLAGLLKRSSIPTGDFGGSVKQITDAYDSLVAENRVLKDELKAIRKVVGATSEVEQ